MRIGIRMSSETKKEVELQLNKAYQSRNTRLIKRIHVILFVVAGKSLEEVADDFQLSVEGVRNYVKAFLLRGVKSLVYKRPSGRPSKLGQKAKRELSKCLDEGPEKAGYESGCWTTALIQDLIHKRFGVWDSSQYVAELLKNMGYSYQRARFVTSHLRAVSEKQAEWIEESWPELKEKAQKQGALILFGDEVTFAQWGSLSYAWARSGEQPTVQTCGIRKGYKVFGAIDFFSGRFFFRGIKDKFNALTYQAFLKQVLEKRSNPYF